MISKGPARQARRRAFGSSSLVIAALWAGTTLLHYLSPQARLLPAPFSTALDRHAFERILFVLPATIATFAHGWVVGGAVLGVAVLTMLPRAIWISPHPTDALVETGAAALVGSLIIWLIQTQVREQVLAERALSRLGALNAVAGACAAALRPADIAQAALAELVDKVGLEGGVSFLMQQDQQSLRMSSSVGISAEAAGARMLGIQDPCCSEALSQQRSSIPPDPAPDSDAPLLPGLAAKACIPLVGKRRVQGLFLVARAGQPFQEEELALFTAIGHQVGIALENASLHASTRFYARQVVRSQEDERKRIARELHDETIQSIGAAMRRAELLSAILSEATPTDALERLATLQELLRSTLRGLRALVGRLRPQALDHLGLMAALERLIQNLRSEGLEAELSLDGSPRPLGPEAELGLFRIAQEALNNAGRHAQATKVRMEIAFMPAAVRLRISDDGCGFQVPNDLSAWVSAGKLGLVGMRERAEAAGGTLTVQSELGCGTHIEALIPLEPRPTA